jgi:protoporphyrinogen oxidase
VDYGSHRLHPSCDPEILTDLQIILGDDLLDRPRHGRIRLRNQWIHFPLKPLDLAFKLPLGFSVGTTLDMVRKPFDRKQKFLSSESFASALEAGLGRTICHEFYFPYARKIWGLNPEDMSVTQAQRRVSASSLKKILLKVLSVMPGFKSPNSGRFFYPRQGFGQIAHRLYEEASKAGVKFHLGTRVESLQVTGLTVEGASCRRNERIETLPADYIWSTIPITTLVQSLQPPAPPSVLQASSNIQYRAMILVYLILEQERFSEYDAHFFPSFDNPISRLSEPKNYSNTREPRDRTVLCAEIPCSPTDPVWSLSNNELGKLVREWLDSAGIGVKAPVVEVVSRRLSHAYPIYRRGFEVYFDQIDAWLARFENLTTFGRQGLFVHDNTHHALYMGYAAVKCLNGDGSFDHNRWNHFRRIFDSHVVED